MSDPYYIAGISFFADYIKNNPDKNLYKIQRCFFLEVFYFKLSYYCM